jgi:hypothetical protein
MLIVGNRGDDTANEGKIVATIFLSIRSRSIAITPFISVDARLRAHLTRISPGRRVIERFSSAPAIWRCGKSTHADDGQFASSCRDHLEPSSPLELGDLR